MRTLGAYTLTRQLGVGGMGEVWCAHREALGGSYVEVAIKVLSATTTEQSLARKMFLDEARLSMQLQAANIVRVFDAAEDPDDKTCYMVMELIDGLDLSKLCAKLRERGKQLPDFITAYIVGEVLKGLAHAHDFRHAGVRKTIVHRDVSPQNVMLSVSGDVKIMDFGIARVASEETSGMFVKGKPRYMPPEQLGAGTREPTLDLFAVGAILHELLDGHEFRGQILDQGHLLGMILAGEVPPMSRDPNTIPVELERLRQRLLAADPQARPASARAAFRELTKWSGYRDASFELEELVRSSAEQDDIDDEAVPTRVMGASVSTRRSAESVTTQPPRITTHTTDTTDSPVHAAARTRRILQLVATTLAAALLGLCVIHFVPRPTHDARGASAPSGGVERAPIEAAAQTQAPAGIERRDPPALVLQAEPAAALELPVEAAGDLELDPDLELSEDEAESRSRTQPAAAKVKVVISLDEGVKYLELKLGGRTVILDGFEQRRTTLRIVEGRHVLSYRTQYDGSWERGPKLGITRAKSSLRFTKSGSFVLD